MGRKRKRRKRVKIVSVDAELNGESKGENGVLIRAVSVKL